MESSKQEEECIMDGEVTTKNIDGCVEDSQDQMIGNVNQSQRVSFPYQILLTLIFFASQISVEFYSIYGILSLQYFGLPTYLISSPSLVSGLLSLTIIPIIGAFSDQGPRPKFRKTVIQAIGLCFLLMAYMLIGSSAAITSNDPIRDIEEDSSSLQLNISSRLNTYLQSEQSSNNGGTVDIANDTVPARNSTNLSSEERTGITVAGVLGIIALSCISIGYDMTMSLTKGLIVECVPSRQKTQILNTSTILTGLGGGIMSCVGMLDLPHYLGKRFNTDGMALTLILFCSAFSLVSILMFGISMRAALLLYYRTKSTKMNGNKVAASLNGDTTIAEESRMCEQNILTDNDTGIGSDIQTHDHETACEGQPSFKNMLESSDTTQSISITQGSVCSDSRLRGKDSKQDTRLCSGYPRNTRFILTIFSAFLSMGCILTGSLYASHTLTIEVYKGDPTASPGTPARDNYEEGIKMASVGFLISSVVFVSTSLVNTKLLKCIDHHLLFAISSVTIAISTLLYCLLKSIATFFIAMGAFGFFRCMGHVILFANALKYSGPSNKKSPKTDNSPDGIETPVGRITSLVGATIPLHLLLLFFMGPAIESIGNSWLPMLYMVGLSGLNAVINLMMKIF